MSLLFFMLLLNQFGREPLSVVERDALTALFNSTGGQNWKEKHGWLSASDPCDWKGVLCEQTFNGVKPGSTVSGLMLPFNNLRGEIPMSIWALPGLRVLDVRGNDLS